MKKRLLVILTFITAMLAATLITGCNKVEELTTLKDPVIKGYDPEVGKITWEFVEHAELYEITLSDGTNTNTTTVKTNSVSYKTDADQFEFSITAKSGSFFKDSQTVSVSFVKLEADLTVSLSEDGAITWDPVDGATGYDVMIDNKTVSVADTSYSDITAGGVHSVRVKPVREGAESTIYYSAWSKPISVNKLGTVATNAITYKDGYIMWNSVASATGYKVNVNNVDYDAVENKLAYSASGESFTVTVQAIGNHTTTCNGAVSEQKSFVYLPTVDGITVENGVLTWNAVEGASGYQLKLNANSQPITLTGNTYNKLSAGTQYSVTVMPTAKSTDTTYFSDWSAVAPIYILPAPVLNWTGVEVDGTDKVNAINWNVVDGAGGYGYKVTRPDGTVQEEVLGPENNFYSDSFHDTGVYTVEIKATSAAADKFESAYSAPMTVTRLAAPTVTTDRISSTATTLSKGFTVTFNAVGSAQSYALFKNGTQIGTSVSPQFTVTDIVEADNTRETDVTYYIQSIGRVAGKNVILNSVPSSTDNVSTSAFTIKVLATPTMPTIEGTLYSFTGTSNNNGYNVNISGQDKTANGVSLDLNDLLAAGNYDVAVCSMGNGHEVLASTYSTSIRVERLSAPYNLTISTDESDGVLSFIGDNRASSYEAVITGQPEPLKVDVTTNIKEYIKTTATVIYMYGVRNEFYDEQHTVYYMSSRASTNYTFYKLETPGSVNFSNDYMTWNKPTNLSSSSSYTPTYKIYNNANGSIYNGNFSGNSYSLTNLEGGKSYAFGIVAIGDGSTCVNSDLAVSREIYKLETPTLNVNVTDFRYEWDSIASASGYVLSIDGNIVNTDIHQSGNLYTYVPHYDKVGNHVVILYATGDNGATTVSSDQCEYTQVVNQLTTPEFNYSYSADSYEPDGNITVNITRETNCPNGYYYVIGGTAHFAKESVYSFVPNTSGEITISTYAKGGGFDSSEVYYIDSRAAATVTLTLLGYPTVNTIDVNEDGRITWGQVKNASGYIFKLTIVGTDGKNYVYEGTINSNTTTLNLGASGGFTAVDEQGNQVTLKYTQVRTMKLELQAKGTLSANTTTIYNGSVTSEKVTKEWSSDLH